MDKEKEISETLMEIGAYHLGNGCDETCDFYRNGDCDSIPVHCVWEALHIFFKHWEDKQAEEK